ncbi:MAG TPA: hypothetical protein VIN56_01790 [Candidatus Dormibacteraeota bacterium]
MTITHCYTNGYTVALDDDGQLDRTNTSSDLLDFDMPESRDAMHAILADATATIARQQVSTVAGSEAEIIRLTELLEARDTTIAAMRSETERMGQLHTTWKDELTDDLHRRATEQNLCSQFDDFCQKHGLRRRVQDYDVTVTVSYQTTLTVTAADEDQARDQASSIMNDSHQFPGTIYTGNYSLSEQDWDIQDVELS